MRSITIHEPADDCPHHGATESGFQESALFVWHDIEAGVGGFWRIGQEPVIRQLSSCFGVFMADGTRFRSNVTGVPMAAADRGDTHMGWGTVLRADLDALAITADFPDLQASLHFEDFFPRYAFSELVGSPARSEHHKAHFEVAGRMRGHITIAGREIAVNALGYRDRSWGQRTWGTLRATRWWPSVFGPDLTAHCVAVVDESFHGAFGYVMRDGIPSPMHDIDVVSSLDYDALTPRSAIARFTFNDGERGELHHRPGDGVGMHVRGYTAVESIGTVTWGDRVGMSNFEISTNPTGGTRLPVVAFGANYTDGLTRR